MQFQTFRPVVLPPGAVAVYRLTGADWRLLYVGISEHPLARWIEHSADKPWFGEVTGFHIEWHVSRPEALRVEADAISRERPVFNVAGSPYCLPTPRSKNRHLRGENFTPRRAISVSNDQWALYGQAVGASSRSDDLREYMKWRVDNPTTPLPGRRRGPVKRERKPAMKTT